MHAWRSAHQCVRAAVCPITLLLSITSAHAAQISVGAGGDLQAAINAAKAGDTIVLQAGATFTGNFVLPVHAGTDYVTIRSNAADAVLPADGVRITPAYAPYLPKIVSPSNAPALRTAPSAAYWRLMFIELGPNANTAGDILDLGDGSSAQYALSQLPHHITVDRVYIHGHALNGHKRGIGLNSGDTTISNSYVADIKAVGSDTQAIGGWNGSGPYLIENNYLEASTQMIMFGGDDPKIANLVPADITVQGNTMSRPAAWKSPILATPAAAVAATATGNLAAGTYGYKVVARRTINGTQVKSAASAEVTVAVAAGSRVTVTWAPVPDAADYLVYGRTPGSENVYWVTATTTFADDGTSGGAAGTPPTSGTVWQVKNIFELKNARRVQIDHNLLENNWAQAQAGTAILFTPRNQGGVCTWCTVEAVTFEYNIVRNIAAGFQVMGYDNLHPSQQANTIRIANNEISGLDKTTWGGNGYLVTITSTPRDITIDHNTIISPSGGGIVLVDSVTTGFVLTNNVARHNSYGIMSSAGIGNPTIAAYFPNSTIVRNVLAGGKASLYPADNLFPTTTDFQAHFVDYAGGNFSLVTGTDWANAGTDGRDLGADQAGLRGATDPPVDALQLTTTSVPATTEGLAYDAPIAATGGVQPYRWSIVAGSLPPGISFDAVSATLIGSAAASGDYGFSVQVADQKNTTAVAALSIHVTATVAILSGSLPDGMVGQPYAQALEATGGSGTYSWRITSGTPPPGLTLGASGMISGTAAASGSYPFQVAACDAANASQCASAGYSLTIVPAPNVAPTVAITSPTSGGSAIAGATITIAAAGSDSDGAVQRIDLYVNNGLIGSASGASIATSWPVPNSGSYSFTAVATDDRGASTTSAAVTVTATSEIVLYASQAKTVAGKFTKVSDATAAQGIAIATADAKKLTSVAAASPTTYVNFTFYAEAGRAYHFWMRGKAQRNLSSNDSAYVQFSGVAAARIGTTGALTYTLEDSTGAGVSGWGWQDNGFGTNVLGANVVFETTGPQTIRIQPREDGLSIDQIVLSPQRYLTASPGALKNDSTILSQ